MSENSPTEQFIVDLLSDIAANGFRSSDHKLVATLRPYKSKDYFGANVYSFSIGRVIAHYAGEDVHDGKNFLDKFLKNNTSKGTEELKLNFGEALEVFAAQYLDGRRNRPENFYEYCGYMHNLFLSCCFARHFVLIPVLIDSMTRAFKKLAFDVYIERGNYQKFADDLLSSPERD